MIQIEGMEKLTLNTKIEVLISCAGTGSRMNKVNENLHKALLPFQDAPILWHIIDKIPTNKKVGILLGHNSNQIRDFIEIAFPDRHISFVSVNDYASTYSGTAVSLLNAENHLADSFWYLPCDGYLDNENSIKLFSNYEQDLLVVAPLTSVINPLDFTVVESVENKLNNFTYKSEFKHFQNPLIFTGIMYIKFGKSFLSTLRGSKELEFVSALNEDFRLIEIASWRDLGSPGEYEKNSKENVKYDFSKPDEVTYLLTKSVIKYDLDIQKIKQKNIKPNITPDVYPSKIRTKGNFLSYAKIEGQTLYNQLEPQRFSELLKWLNDKLWVREKVELTKDITEFYQQKTLDRISSIKTKLPYNLDRCFTGNSGLSLLPSQILESIKWDTVKQNPISSIIHGDLQFDNIIYKTSGEFKLIDWRTSFGSQSIYGDLYYDLAKLLGGIYMDYSEIKKNNFSFNILSGDYAYRFPSCPFYSEILEIFKRYCEENSFNFLKIQYLTAIIYLNMSPLHNRPFSDLLFFHSLEMLEKS